MPRKVLWQQWKEKSQVDYIPVFMALWVSLNAWMKNEYEKMERDRDYIDLLKRDTSKLSDRFAELINPGEVNPSSLKFHGNFAELIESLKHVNIYYKKTKKKISFENCVITWEKEKEKRKYESVIVIQKHGESKIKIDDKIWVDNNVQRVFAAYIEILYQIRCALFHGTLSPIRKNETVIKHLYLTLSMIMEGVQ